MQPSVGSQESGIGPPPGVVELREDVPLKGSGGESLIHCGGPRLIVSCFVALSAAVTIALLTQIYYGHYEVVPHGSVSSDAAECSAAGTDVLKRGGNALDAAAASALCLAIIAMHRTSLDAGGAMVYWQYRQSRTQPAMVYEWGGPTKTRTNDESGKNPPRMVAALATLHSRLGVLPWRMVLQPAIDLARKGYRVSNGLAVALLEVGDSGQTPPNRIRNEYQIADYLESLQNHTSAELSALWGPAAEVRSAPARETNTGTWRVLAPVSAAPGVRALLAALDPLPTDVDDASRRAEAAVSKELAGGARAGGAAAGLAVVDPQGTYLALVTGMSTLFGTGPRTTIGWRYDEPTAPLDLAPAIMVTEQICGTRFVMGAESWVALAQSGAALGASGGVAAVERAWGGVGPGVGPSKGPGAGPGVGPGSGAGPARAPPAVNVVQQTGDALLSHADSRGGGLASRF